ncbi:MAG: primosomal protein [Leptolyngbyaceae cyanobacterium RM1_406_9]|nr:primosomal protein [Leptolyngbyaceae cyanobacterium RM1_406_9]
MATTTKPRTPNGTRNSVTSKAAKPNGTASTTKAKAPTVDGSPETHAAALLKELRNLVFKEYGVKLQLRDARVSTKIGHATREKLGLDIAAQVKKKGGNKKFDWQRWNTKVFPRLFGQPDALKYSPEVVAVVMSLLYDTIRTDPEQAVADLVEFNRASLERRNSFQAEQDDELDDLDDELDDELDDDLSDEQDDESSDELDDELDEELDEDLEEEDE